MFHKNSKISAMKKGVENFSYNSLLTSGNLRVAVQRDQNEHQTVTCSLVGDKHVVLRGYFIVRRVGQWRSSRGFLSFPFKCGFFIGHLALVKEVEHIKQIDDVEENEHRKA